MAPTTSDSTAAASDVSLTELADGVFIWRAIHPEWNPSIERVGCYALKLEGGLAVIDPLLPPDPAGQRQVLDALAARAGGGEVVVFTTIPYHVRDAELVAHRFDAPIVGHASLGRRLDEPHRLVDVVRTPTLPLGMRALRIGKPVRAECPLYSSELRVLCFGDAIVGAGNGELRVWDVLDTEARRLWYRERFVPSMAPLLKLDIDHVLVTHGEPVLGAGGAALARAMYDHEPGRLREALTGPAALG